MKSSPWAPRTGSDFGSWEPVRPALTKRALGGHFEPAMCRALASSIECDVILTDGPDRLGMIRIGS